MFHFVLKDDDDDEELSDPAYQQVQQVWGIIIYSQ